VGKSPAHESVCALFLIHWWGGVRLGFSRRPFLFHLMITFVWHLAQQPFCSSWRKEDRRIAVQLLVVGVMATVCEPNLVQQMKST
jgi:hypothetical protein